MNITDITARQILDSRGNPTVEADVWVDGKFAGRAAVPSGASTGVHEAHELRDGGTNFGGQGVNNAVNNITAQILPALRGLRADDQFLIDQIMIDLDGTENKSRLGANAILAVSLASAHAAAKTRGVELYSHINDIHGGTEMTLPLPMMNVLNGGKHATNSSDFQEFMIIPVGADSIADAIQAGVEIFQELKASVKKMNVSTAVGDEGGFTYPVKKNTEMLDFLMQAIEQAGYLPGKQVGLGLDVAAAELYDNGIYKLEAEGGKLNTNQMQAYLSKISKQYPILSIEDGLDQDDWEGWRELVGLCPHLQLVGDDLLVTNPARLSRAIETKAANAILIKPNQIGTLTETLRAIKLAQENNYASVISHRSGETEDVTIAHLAVGTGAGQIKTGSLSRSERTAKYNELMRIAQANPNLSLAQPF